MGEQEERGGGRMWHRNSQIHRHAVHYKKFGKMQVDGEHVEIRTFIICSIYTICICIVHVYTSIVYTYSNVEIYVLKITVIYSIVNLSR